MQLGGRQVLGEPGKIKDGCDDETRKEQAKGTPGARSDGNEKGQREKGGWFHNGHFSSRSIRQMSSTWFDSGRRKRKTGFGHDGGFVGRG